MEKNIGRFEEQEIIFLKVGGYMSYEYNELDAVGWAISTIECEIERCKRERDMAYFYFDEEGRRAKADKALTLACEMLVVLQEREKQLEGK